MCFVFFIRNFQREAGSFFSGEILKETREATAGEIVQEILGRTSEEN